MKNDKGIEMLQRPASKFSTMKSNQTQLGELFSYTLANEDFFNLCNTKDISLCGDGMPNDLVVDIAMTSLEFF
jgi:hypothetical protein